VAQQLHIAVFSRAEDHVASQLTHVLESPGVAALVAGKAAPPGRHIRQVGQLGIPAHTGHSVGGSEAGESTRGHLVAVEVHLVDNERALLTAQRY